MTEKLIIRQIITVYFNLWLRYKEIGVGNETENGYIVTQKSIDIFAARLQKYLTI